MGYKTISIVIPYYQETEEKVFPLLSSINNQVGIDFEKIEVILANDAGEMKVSNSFLDLFSNFKTIVVHCVENGGPGLARQKGLDHATGEYVIFCDADDVLQNVAASSDIGFPNPACLLLPFPPLRALPEGE